MPACSGVGQRGGQSCPRWQRSWPRTGVPDGDVAAQAVPVHPSAGMVGVWCVSVCVWSGVHTLPGKKTNSGLLEGGGRRLLDPRSRPLTAQPEAWSAGSLRGKMRVHQAAAGEPHLACRRSSSTRCTHARTVISGVLNRAANAGMLGSAARSEAATPAPPTPAAAPCTAAASCGSGFHVASSRPYRTAPARNTGPEPRSRCVSGLRGAAIIAT